MARFHITGPDGASYEIDAPEGASDSDVMRFVQEQVSKPKRPETSQMESLGRGAIQGATFGFGDEIYGAGAGAYDKLFGSGDFSGTYSKNRDEVRAANDAARESNPGTYFAGEIAGGVALPGASLRVGVKGGQLVNAGLKARSAAAARTGAKYGAAYGLGTAEGDVVDQALGTVGGAVGGGITGGLLPGAIQLGGAALRAPIQAARVAAQPQRIAAEKVAESFSRDAASVPSSRPIIAAEHALRREAARGDGQLILADMGGENTKNLMRSAVNMPNASAERFNQVLNRRQAVAPKNIESSLSDNLAPGSEFYAAIDDIVTKRDAMATPMFRAAFAVETKMTPKLDRVLQRPTMQELNQLVARKLADEDKPIGLMTRTEHLHRMKLELDEQIGMSMRAEKMGNRPTQGWDTRTLMTLKKDLLDAIDNAPYKYALQKYAGPSALKTAAEDGFEEALKLAPEQIGGKLKGLSSSEAQMWRMGAARAITDQVRRGNFMRDRTKSIFDTPDMRLRLKQIFPDNRTRAEFLRDVANERRKASTRHAAQGNSTTAKQLINAQEAGKGIRTAADVAGAATGKVGALISLLERGSNFASGITPGVANEILKILMHKASNSRAHATSSQALQEALSRVQARRVRQDQIAGALLPAPGVLFGEASASSGRK